MFDRFRFRGWAAPALLLGLCLLPSHASADSAIYGGGPFYGGGQAVMDDLRASGFTTVILFGVHVQTNGDLHYNNEPIISNGSYIGDPDWPARLATLKQAPTSVDRIEASIGGWGTGDFANIKNLIAAQGTGPGSVLYKNFQLLKQITGADAIDFDDESTYDLNSSTQFGNMLWGLGYSITLAPYTNQSYWVNLKNNLAGKVDGIHLQVYDGGAGNDPASWSNALGMTVDPGVWSKHGSGCTAGDGPSSVQNKMQNWKNSAGIVGGFIWLYDDIQACWSQGTTAQYAAAINNAIAGPPVASFGYVVAADGLDVSFTDFSSDPDGSIVSRDWDFGDGATSTETNPLHAYAAPGIYTVTLTVTDNDGESASKSDSVVAGLVNLALNRPATGATACNGSETPDKAVNGSVDGGNGDKFCTLASSQWLQVDLGALRNINQFVIRHAGAGGESSAWNTRAYSIRVSSDGNAWSTAAATSSNAADVSSHAIAETAARYVRLDIATPSQDGSSPAGRIYEFEVYGSGTTPPPPPTEVNLALNRPATGSSACSGSETPAKAVNGSVTGGNSDKFCSPGDSGGFFQPKKYWLQVDLGSSQSIRRFVIKHAGAGGESTAWNTKAYNIQVSSNGSSWATVATVSNNGASTTSHDIAPVDARYVKLNITTPAQDGNAAARIYEFEVY